MSGQKSETASLYTRREFFSRSGRMIGRVLGSALDTLGPLRRSPQNIAATIVPGSWVRPPGALDKEEDFLSACTRCGGCIKACPPLVLRPLGPEWGARLEGTPSLFPKEGPCLMCEGFPCIAACPEEALLMPGTGENPRLGTAWVDESSCLLKDAQPCRECERVCPPAYGAVRADRGLGRAVIDEKTCVGCGLCAQICPVQAVEIRH